MYASTSINKTKCFLYCINLKRNTASDIYKFLYFICRSFLAHLFVLELITQEYFTVVI